MLLDRWELSHLHSLQHPYSALGDWLEPFQLLPFHQGDGRSRNRETSRLDKGASTYSALNWNDSRHPNVERPGQSMLD